MTAQTDAQTSALLPVVVDVHRRGEGPFAGSEGRIKFRYVAKG